MKATGIVRRIDDLGRIVIPKEIRRTLRIRETDPLEIYTEKTGEIVLKKYSQVGEMVEFAKDYADSLASTTGQIVCITDREQIIAATGNLKKELISKPITKELEEFIEQRTPVVANDSSRGGINIVEDKDLLKGDTKVEVEGQPGNKELLYKITYHNGKQVEKKFIEEVVVTKPVDKVIKKELK